MTLTAVLPTNTHSLFQRFARDPISGDPCFPTTAVAIVNKGVTSTLVYPASSTPMRLLVKWNNLTRVLGFIKPEFNYTLNDEEVPSDATFSIVA